LGRYAEPLRQFLFGEKEFPPEMVLWCAVFRTPEPPPVISYPVGELTSEGYESFHRHIFNIPGLSYTLHVGQRVPKGVRELCTIRSPRRLLFFTPIQDVITRKTAELFHKSPPSPLLRKLHRRLTGEEL
jgi:hypothetical protein